MGLGGRPVALDGGSRLVALACHGAQFAAESGRVSLASLLLLTDCAGELAGFVGEGVAFRFQSPELTVVLSGRSRKPPRERGAFFPTAVALGFKLPNAITQPLLSLGEPRARSIALGSDRAEFALLFLELRCVRIAVGGHGRKRVLRLAPLRSQQLAGAIPVRGDFGSASLPLRDRRGMRDLLLGHRGVLL